MPLTLEEQERRAYISGNVEAARLLAHAIDGDDETAADLQRTEEELKDAERTRDDHANRVEELEGEVDDLKLENTRLQDDYNELHETFRAALVGENA